MGSPTCPYCGCLAVTRAVEADGNAPSRSAAYRCERCLKLHERRPTPPAPADDASGDDGTCIDGHPHRCGRCDRDIVERRADDASGAEAGEDVVVYRGPDGGDFGTSREGPEDEAWVAVPAARRDRERAEAKTLRRLLGRAVKLLEDEGFTVFPDEVRAALAVFRTGGERPASGQGG